MSGHRRQGRPREDNNQPQQAPLGNFNLGSLATIINSLDVNQFTEAINRAGKIADERAAAQGHGDGTDIGNGDIIRAMRTLINSDKTMLLQTIIQLYAMSKNQKR